MDHDKRLTGIQLIKGEHFLVLWKSLEQSYSIGIQNINYKKMFTFSKIV